MSARMEIWDICRAFEWKHRPEVLISVEKERGLERYEIKMGATSFINGKFNREARRVVVLPKKNLRIAVNNVLEELYCELYDE